MKTALKACLKLLLAFVIILSALMTIVLFKQEIRMYKLDDGMVWGSPPPPRYEQTFEYILDQCAEKELKERYTAYLPDRVVANARKFGGKITKKTSFVERYSVFVLLDLQEYVIFKTKAYSVYHRQGEAVIDYERRKTGCTLKGIEWCPEGEDPDTWIRERFPEGYLAEKSRNERLEKQGKAEPLSLTTDRIALEMLGVPVDRGRTLTIDEYNGDYELSEAAGAYKRIIEKDVLKRGSPRVRALYDDPGLLRFIR
ncbi:MAG: hypothetical protein IK083_07480 [Abditibacteriota bacterium]|nr:hypothetical protein [Abditibacteriota bacterium]